MGFCINEEQKVNITLSEKANTIILDDWEIFSTFTLTGFLNTIIENFCEDAKASYTEYCNIQTKKFKDLLENSNLSQKSKNTVLKIIHDSIQKEVKQQLNEYIYLKPSSKARLLRLNKANCRYLELYDDIEHELDIYTPNSKEYIHNVDGFGTSGYLGISRYLKCIFEEYASLPFIQRVRIIRKKEYEIVTSACNNNELKIQQKINGKAVSFTVSPYKIIPDKLGLQEYLTCLSKSSSDDKTRPSSFSMLRLESENIKVISKKKKKLFFEKEVQTLEKEISERTPTFLLGESERIHVKLTEKGKEFYRRRLNYRPQKINSESTEDEYVFSCTEQQAYVYFLSFGKDAEIIAPEKLRKRMKEFYESASNKYNQ